MGSDSRSPRARHRFGFSGLVARQKRDRVTTDDILDSLTRQAELRQKLGENDSLRLEEIAGTDELSQLQAFNPEPAFPTRAANKRGFGHFAFFFMLVAGLTIVWLFSLASAPFDLQSLNGITQKSGIQSIFANQTRLGIIALAACLSALWIRSRRRESSRHIPSN